MDLGPRATAEFANAVAHAFGLRDERGALVFDAPTTSLERDAIEARIGRALDARKPSASAPSMGELVAALAWGRPVPRDPRRWPPRPKRRPAWSTRRALAELTELVAQGSFDRTKRAERGRLLAQLILLFDLEAALELSLEPGVEPEDALRRVRRALATRP